MVNNKMKRSGEDIDIDAVVRVLELVAGAKDQMRGDRQLLGQAADLLSVAAGRLWEASRAAPLASLAER